MAAVNTATGQVLSTRSPVDRGRRPASYETSLVVSGGVDCGRRRRLVYGKKPQRYAKDNRTAHLTARSDKSQFSSVHYTFEIKCSQRLQKSVAYETNNKRLDVLYC